MKPKPKPIMAIDVLNKLAHMDYVACSGGYEWARGKTMVEAWKTCDKRGWLTWLARAVGIDSLLEERSFHATIFLCKPQQVDAYRAIITTRKNMAAVRRIMK